MNIWLLFFGRILISTLPCIPRYAVAELIRLSRFFDYRDFNSILESVTVFWKYSLEDGPYNQFLLEFISGNMYSGIMPQINSNSRIEYFIVAMNSIGDSFSHPYAGWHIFDSLSYILGDVNSDNVINILDVILIVNIVLGLNDYSVLADVNIDGNIDILDVVELINIILD